ncbi:MAG: SprB repeat-containing protein [Chitinophagales bacterium]|nr:SprB repeat-containing protein [Chitinophagales bacterium]
MKYRLLPHFYCLIAFLLLHSELHACGYGFIGDCSTRIRLRINNTPDSFNIAACNYGHTFQQTNLGAIRNLQLDGGDGFTWESCQNNATVLLVHYRVYPFGQQGGSWQTMPINEVSNSISGPYTTRHFRRTGAAIALHNGLPEDQNYTLELYLEARIDTIGDDFIPETGLLQHNGGQYYKLHFRYEGADGPPFAIVNTLRQLPRCNGESNGVLGVSVYGTQNPLTYTWQGYFNNFYALYNLAAGTYTVSVAEQNGPTLSQTIVLPQPQTLQAQALNIQIPACNGIGSIQMGASGGTPPYHYFWSNGDTTASIAISGAGIYQGVLRDAMGCEKNYSVEVPAGNPAQASLAGLPAQLVLSCNHIEENLCAQNGNNLSFQWEKDGTPAVGMPCLLAAAGGQYKVTATWTENGATCTASKSIAVEEHFIPPIASYSGQIQMKCDLNLIDSTLLTAQSNSNNVQYRWVYQGDTIGTTAQLLFKPVVYQQSSGFLLPDLYVRDTWGCTALAAVNIGIIPISFPNVNAQVKNRCDGNFEIKLQISEGIAPFQYSWSNGSSESSIILGAPADFAVTLSDAQNCITGTSGSVAPLLLSDISVQAATAQQGGQISVVASGGNDVLQIQWSNGISGQTQLTNLPAGDYCVSITDVDGCSADTCVTVPFWSATHNPETLDFTLFPNPVTLGAVLNIQHVEHLSQNFYHAEILQSDGTAFVCQILRQTQTDLQVQIPDNISAGYAQIRLRNPTRSVLLPVLIVR